MRHADGDMPPPEPLHLGQRRSLFSGGLESWNHPVERRGNQRVEASKLRCLALVNVIGVVVVVFASGATVAMMLDATARRHRAVRTLRSHNPFRIAPRHLVMSHRASYSGVKVARAL